MEANVIWRRVDIPGHDACWLFRRSSGGFRLEGVSVFSHQGAAARLTYSLTCDTGWRAERGRVEGRLGEREISVHVTRAGNEWTLNGAAVADLDECVDLDFGFTPATNLPAIRRLGLYEGQSAEVPAAWLDVEKGALTPLPQRYERRSAGTYWYEAQTLGYEALLEVSETGFVITYPGLWITESARR